MSLTRGFESFVTDKAIAKDLTAENSVSLSEKRAQKMKLAAISLFALACGQNFDEVISCYECQYSISEHNVETGDVNCVEPDLL